MTTRDRYTCQQVFNRLDDYLDRELSAEESQRVTEHLATCAQCLDEYRFEANLRAELKRKLRRLEVPSHLLQSLRQIF